MSQVTQVESNENTASIIAEGAARFSVGAAIVSGLIYCIALLV